MNPTILLIVAFGLSLYIAIQYALSNFNVFYSRLMAAMRKTDIKYEFDFPRLAFWTSLSVVLFMLMFVIK